LRARFIRARVIDRSTLGPSAIEEAALEPLRSIRLQFDPTLARLVDLLCYEKLFTMLT